MKIALITFALFLSGLSIAQEQQAAFELVDHNILYRHYPNKIAVALTNNDGAAPYVTCTNCDTIYTLEDNQLIVVAGNGRKASLSIHSTDGDSLQLIRTKEYRVANLPDPTVFWGAAKDGKKGSKSSRLVQAKYLPEVPIKARFTVNSWKITIGEETVSGKGANLSKAGPLINSATSDSLMLIQIKATGPDGKIRELKGTFSF